jgi:hypothetical protein
MIGNFEYLWPSAAWICLVNVKRVVLNIKWQRLRHEAARSVELEHEQADTKLNQTLLPKY